MPKQARKLKLQQEYRHRSYGGDKIVPSLKLSGVWLEEMGFSPGDMVEVSGSDRVLVIQPARLAKEENAEDMTCTPKTR